MPAAACWMWVGAVAEGMRKISYAGYRFPPEVIHQAIWLYLRFTLSFRDVEDLLTERGIAVSYEGIVTLPCEERERTITGADFQAAATTSRHVLIAAAR